MFYLNIDVSDIEGLFDFDEVAKDEMEAAAKQLTAATHAHIVEMAQQKLHTRRGTFIEALSYFQVDENTWVVNLDAKARWIDEGMDAHNMLEDLLKSKSAKRAKDGSAYVVVPFQHNKEKSAMTPAQQTLLGTIKRELAKVGETPNKLSTDKEGNPKLGLVRSMDITKAPMSTPNRPIGRGTGSVAKGPTGIPLLKGIRIYQKEITKKDGSKGVGRFVMTFRVASSKHKGEVGNGTTEPWRIKKGAGVPQARWDHPGVSPTNLMEDGMRWAQDQWDSKIAPALLTKLVVKLR